MKRMIAWLLVAVMVLSCAGIVACGGDGGGGATVDDGATTDGGGTTTDGGGTTTDDGGTTTDDNGGNGGGDSLTDILGIGAGIDSVQYDMVMTSPDSSQLTIHVWLKGNKMKSETDMGGGQGTVVSIADMDEGVMYQYFPDQNMAYKMSYDQPENTALTETQAISGYHPTELGTETVDGKVCLVVEYSQAGATVKMWIWKEHGFPVKVETTTAEGTTTIEYKNIDFSNIPDSEFEVDPGVTIMEI